MTALEPELETVARWMALHTVHTIETARLLVQAGRDAGMSPGAIERAAHRHVLDVAITLRERTNHV